MWVYIISLFIVLFKPAISFGENSFIASAYNQIRNGRTCGQVTGSDLKKAGFTCGFGHPIEELSISAWEVFEWNVFQLGADNQIDKNQCLNEQISAFMKDERLLKTWFSQLTAAWMGMKKSDLILEKCQAEVAKRASPENIRQYGYKKAYEMSNNPLGQEWDAMCFDNEKISALKAARSLFPFALPVVSNSEFFKIMEKHRNMIIDKKTGKPLTDDDLLKANLQDLSFMKLKLGKGFESDMRESLSRFSLERATVTKKIQESKTNGSYRLSDDLKDYIFQDETIYQTLSSRNLMGSDYSSLEKTKSEDPNYKPTYDRNQTNSKAREKEEASKVPVSNGAFCILAKYEPTLTGEVINFAATSALAGGLVFKALKGTKYLAGLSTAGQVKKSAGYGLALTGYPMIAQQVYNSCGGNDEHTAKKVVSAAKKEVFASIQASDLPAEVGYGTWNLEVDPQQTPSCKKAEDKNLMLNKKYKSNCLIDSLLAVSPLKISLPVILGTAL